MARGWESKSVESQMEAARERASLVGRAAFDREKMELERERASLQLSRTRVLQDLENATHPRYREMLQRSLDFLNEKLAKLEQLSKSDLRG